MSVLIPLMIILIAEDIGDFFLQSREIASNKTKKAKFLGIHLFHIFALVSLGAFIGFSGTVSLAAILCFGLSYALVHGIQDLFIWKGYYYIVSKRIKSETLTLIKTASLKKELVYENVYKDKMNKFIQKKEYSEDKTFYDFIGLDRLLHILSLILLYGLFFL